MKIIFEDLNTFKFRIRQVFKDVDTEWTVEQELMNLLQKSSATVYATQF